MPAFSPGMSSISRVSTFAPKDHKPFNAEACLTALNAYMADKKEEYDKASAVKKVLTRYKEKEKYAGRLRSLLTKYIDALPEDKEALRSHIISELDSGCNEFSGGYSKCLRPYHSRLTTSVIELKEERKEPPKMGC